MKKNTNKKAILAATVAVGFVLTGCVTDGSAYRSDVYSASQVNQAQEVQPVTILAVMPARVAVSNGTNRQRAQSIGMLMGAIAGIALMGHGNHHNPHAMPDRVIGGIGGAALGGVVGSAAATGSTQVQGVQITYRRGSDGKMFNSVQVGNPCEYQTGLAVMVSTDPTSTRIQPNNPLGCAAQTGTTATTQQTAQ